MIKLEENIKNPQVHLKVQLWRLHR